MIAFLEIIKYLVPTLLIASILYYFLNNILEKIELIANRPEKNIELDMLKLQSHERMVIFLERIKPISLVNRVNISENPQLYKYSLIKTIQDEFEHNVGQQIYIKSDTWNLIFETKNFTQNFINNCSENLPKSFSSIELKDEILRQYNSDSFPSEDVLIKLREDVNNL